MSPTGMTPLCERKHDQWKCYVVTLTKQRPKVAQPLLPQLDYATMELRVLANLESAGK